MCNLTEIIMALLNCSLNVFSYIYKSNRTREYIFCFTKVKYNVYIYIYIFKASRALSSEQKKAVMVPVSK